MARTQPLAPMNHYEILGVPSTATTQQIREQFKRLILEAHPDKNPERPEWSEKRVRELIEAFDVLVDQEKRADFDRVLGVARRTQKRHDEPFFYRKKDPQARAMLILHHLLNNRPQVATAILGEMEERLGGGFLCENLDRADDLDCLFLLAEHYAESREYRTAARKFALLYACDRESRFPRHYLGEVERRLKDLYLKKLPRVAETEEALDGLRAAKDLGLSKSEELGRLRRLAEILSRLGHHSEARREIRRAIDLCPEDSTLLKVEAGIDSAENKSNETSGCRAP